MRLKFSGIRGEGIGRCGGVKCGSVIFPGGDVVK